MHKFFVKVFDTSQSFWKLSTQKYLKAFSLTEKSFLQRKREKPFLVFQKLQTLFVESKELSYISVIADFLNVPWIYTDNLTCQ